ncbi:hypothetical protein M406DRAFT_103543 [Cryphonectria parasitica EP155]|uniref:Uncharacterized protein n=1 Tax=Cryphonectria parasitica (strain ATCC 38755 / EP155) TaxID=660469 RepID=A0A9P4XTD6_CRYP1|nr:uncharacterized protein M406DRAFT_103543 [Cryphonectria parasitica EP155]KAF3760897.1 hypothetical protein M406DRAFT_103543 [Cryphonectria parasitica EP155]
MGTVSKGQPCANSSSMSMLSPAIAQATGPVLCLDHHSAQISRIKHVFDSANYVLFSFGTNTH